MSINTGRTQKAFSEKMDGRASVRVHLRRKMLEVTRVGRFYSFLSVMCRADPEQAGVISFPCHRGREDRGSSPVTLAWGSARVRRGWPGSWGSESRQPCRLLGKPPGRRGAGFPASWGCLFGLSQPLNVRSLYGWCQQRRWQAAAERQPLWEGGCECCCLHIAGCGPRRNLGVGNPQTGLCALGCLCQGTSMARFNLHLYSLVICTHV